MTTLDLAFALVAHPPRLPAALVALLMLALTVVVSVVIGRVLNLTNRSRSDG